MKITRLKVTGLFGLYDYDIDFARHGDDFTILTSPNGYGKTTLLRIINSLDVKRLLYLYMLKYNSLTLWFDDDSEIVAHEIDDTAEGLKDVDTRKNQRRGLLLQWISKGAELCRFDYRPEQIREAIHIAYRKITSVRHFAGDVIEEDLEYYTTGEAGESLNTIIAQMQDQEQFLLQLATIQTDFIGANRIYTVFRRERVVRQRYEQPILQVVYELKEMLTRRIMEFQNNFQRLDSKLIDKLLEDKGAEIDEATYNQKATSLNQLIEELASFGLTNKQNLPVFQSGKGRILDVYLSLMEEKLSYYETLLPLVKLFNKNVQQKHFANKSIRLSAQHGIRIESDNGDILSASKLSTGEQNQLVLLYDLIFKTPENSILLIDEPESSLHVAWQNDFVSDMQLIASKKHLQIVAATHSPIIVSNTSDEKVFDLYYLQSK
jgi:predicted ATP-binding protein involved in virulence